MAGRSKVEESSTDKAKNVAKAAFGGAQMAFSMVFSMTVHSYFLWSSLCFLACGITLTIGWPQVQDFMCARPAQATLGGQGCNNCSSELLACTKDVCYRNAVNLTWMTQAKSASLSLYNPFTEAVTDPVCTELFRSKAETPIQMIVSIADSTETITEGCINYHCGILKNALGADTLAGALGELSSPSGQCTDKYRQGGEGPTCVCGDLISSTAMSQAATKIISKCGVWLNSLCPYGDFVGSWCPTPAPTPPSTTAAANAPTPLPVSRRLEAPCISPGGVPDNATIGRQLQNGRYLQNAPAPAPAANLNDNLPEFTVGEFGKCTCYQQCTPGVKTRTVKCLAAQCKKPAPKSADACHCDHCARCETIFAMFVLSLIYFGQCGVAAICFLCYLHAATSDDSQFIKISCCELLGGLASKNFPPLVRLVVLVTFGFTFWILIQTFIPKIFGLEWMDDCYSSQVLRLVVIICSCVWVFQVLIGRFANRVARKPPWLFSPNRANLPPGLKQLSQLLRGLGP